ncbi:MAG: putative MarR-family transcriptional regulator [Microbacteriaceae bacterium]|nr:putative MarR-family transcriptional regulator [Microbacteriaceae bacterium]
MATELKELGRALKRAQYRHHLVFDRALASIGTTIVQWDALRAINEAPASSAHYLAVTTFQSDQAFGTLAGRLVHKGLITRAPGPGRRIEHHLTPAGIQMLQSGSAIADTVLAQSFAPLAEAERETLFTLLGRVGYEAGQSAASA